ncbi:hypothetical protein AAFH68_16590 [Flavobacterium sp. CGRL1]
MKNLKLWLVILPLITTACSEEYINKTVHTAETASNTLNDFKKLKVSSQNAVNTFDNAENVYNKILDVFCQNEFDLNSVEDAAFLIDSVANSYSELDLLSTDAALDRRIPQIKWIINNDDAIDAIILNSSLGASARISLAGFVQSITRRADDPYEPLHRMIISYQQYVLHSSQFSSNDKQIILTTTSVVEYSVKRKRKDKDWDTSVTKIAAAVAGAGQDIVLSLKMALAVGICQKKKNHAVELIIMP